MAQRVQRFGPRRRALDEPSVLLIGAYGMSNLGDDAILAAIVAELRQTIPGVRCTAVSASPDAPPPAPGLTLIPFSDHAVRDALTTASLLIIGGGGLIFDFRMRASYDDFFGDTQGYFYPHYRAAIVAHGLGVPVQLYAVGVGPLVGPVARGLTRTVCDLAAAISVRDTLSQVELLQLGVAAAKIEVTADPVVRLDGPPGHREATPRVGFSIRNWPPVTDAGAARIASSAAYYERYLDTFAVAADHAVERWGAQAVFFAVQSEWDDDLAFARAVIARMAHGDAATIAPLAEDYPALQRLIGGFDLVVSTRLHGLIIAAGAGIPGIGLNLSTKVRAFLADLGLAELALSPWDGRTATMTETIDRVMARQPEYRARVAAGMARQRALAARNPQISAALIARSDG